MKKTVFGIAICCLISCTVMAQEISSIKNFWKKTYLNTEGGTLGSSATSDALESAQWQFLDAGNGYYRIKNSQNGTFLNIEENHLRSSAIEDGWRSALWTLESTGDQLWTLENSGGGNFIRIRNVWKPKLYINVQNGLECGKIKMGWHSAMWSIEGLRSTTRPASTTLTNQGNNNSSDYFDPKRALDAHNVLRSEVGVAPLVWDDRLAKIAQKWADKLALKNRGENFFLEHSKTRGLGENVAGGFVNGDRPEVRILNGWGENEKVNFDKSTRKCYQGKVCGHYTQIVWRKTTRVGCAVTVNENGKYILVCNYDPPGNMNNGTAF